MAIIDYGCRFKMNGVVQNNESLFMDEPDWVPEVAYYNGREYPIKGDYFAYVGDRDFFLCFYKEYWIAVSGTDILYISSGTRISETRIFEHATVKTDNLDNELRNYSYEEFGMLDEIDRETMTELQIRRLCKRKAREKNTIYKYYSRRYRVTFDYRGNHYDVIYGYGIDDLDVMRELYEKQTYDFTEKDIETLERWFRE